MTRIASSVSRWVLILEMLLCFTPLALLFIAIIANFARFPMLNAFLYLSVAALAPAGLAFAFRIIVLNRPSLPTAATRLLIALAIWTPGVYVIHLIAERGTLLGWCREFILIAILPALAAAHLISLTHSKPQPDATAA